MIFLLPLLLSVVPAILACSEEKLHRREVLPPPPVSLTPPSRALEWGDINIIHTTDRWADIPLLILFTTNYRR